MVPVYASKETTESLGAVVEAALFVESDAIRNDLGTPEQLPRLDKLQRRKDACSVLRAKVRTHAIALSFSPIPLEMRIGGLENRIKELRVLVQQRNGEKAEERKAKRRVGYRKKTRIVRRTGD